MWEKVVSIVGLFIIILSSVAFGGEDYLSEYWKRPILGTDLKSVPKISKLQTPNSKLSLYPEACGECHKEQYNGWKGSLHSKTVGPGLLGQIEPHKNPEFALSCYFCHAPMEEQAEVKQSAVSSQRSAEEKTNYIKNPSFDNRLKLSGVSCSVCHLREGKVYGPPPLTRSLSPVGRGVGEGHNGFIEKDFFEKAEFCAVCHQLDEGYELNGKPLTNTYKEWKESFYGRNNIPCQNCHMPDRRHLWRGVHDPEMVKRGIAMSTVRNGHEAKLVITNTGVGHYFPTYVTPLVVVKGYMEDNKGGVIPESVKVRYIGRRVSLDLSEEFFDTRIPPQGKFEFTYKINRGYNNYRAVFEIWVYPDEFYNRFYRETLKGDGAGINKEEIKRALHITEESGYMLFRKIL